MVSYSDILNMLLQYCHLVVKVPSQHNSCFSLKTAFHRLLVKLLAWQQNAHLSQFCAAVGAISHNELKEQYTASLFVLYCRESTTGLLVEIEAIYFWHICCQ